MMCLCFLSLILTVNLAFCACYDVCDMSLHYIYILFHLEAIFPEPAAPSETAVSNDPSLCEKDIFARKDLCPKQCPFAAEMEDKFCHFRPGRSCLTYTYICRIMYILYIDRTHNLSLWCLQDIEYTSSDMKCMV